jgi:hypothetical protein
MAITYLRFPSEIRKMFLLLMKRSFPETSRRRLSGKSKLVMSSLLIEYRPRGAKEKVVINHWNGGPRLKNRVVFTPPPLSVSYFSSYFFKRRPIFFFFFAGFFSVVSQISFFKYNKFNIFLHSYVYKD